MVWHPVHSWRGTMNLAVHTDTDAAPRQWGFTQLALLYHTHSMDGDASFTQCVHTFVSAYNLKLTASWNSSVSRTTAQRSGSTCTVVVPASPSDVISLCSRVLWLRSICRHGVKSCRWCWLEEPYFLLLWQLDIFVTWWLSGTQSKYGDWSPLLPGWVLQWWILSVQVLEHSHVGMCGSCFSLKEAVCGL